MPQPPVKRTGARTTRPRLWRDQGANPATLARLDRVLAAILEAARARPIVIQSLFCRLDGAPPPPEEIDAYAARLRAIVEGGGHIATVQLHTVARPPAESSASALADAELDAIADRLRAIVAIPISVFYGLPAGETVDRP